MSDEQRGHSASAIGARRARRGRLYRRGWLAACGGSSAGRERQRRRLARQGGGEITIGSFQDNAMAPFRDTFVKHFQNETGIKVNYNETNYDAWYQNAKNDGLNKTGAYDIYVMDDNWVPEFAAGKIVQNLYELGLKVNPDILAKGLEQGYWPPKSGARLKDFASDQPALYALVIIDDVELLYYNKDYFGGAPKTWDDIDEAAKATQAAKLYGWSARGVKGNPIVMTYLPLLNSYGGNFVNDDWSPGFAGPEGVGALERLFSLHPVHAVGRRRVRHRPGDPGDAAGQVHGADRVHGPRAPRRRPDAPRRSWARSTWRRRRRRRRAARPSARSSAASPRARRTRRARSQFLEWFTSSQGPDDFARGDGSAAVTGIGADRPGGRRSKYRWLPAIKDAVDNSVPKPKTPDEPKFEDILGTALNKALVEAIAQRAATSDRAEAPEGGGQRDDRVHQAAGRLLLGREGRRSGRRPGDAARRARLLASPCLLLLPATHRADRGRHLPAALRHPRQLPHYRYGRDLGFDGLENYRMICTTTSSGTRARTTRVRRSSPSRSRPCSAWGSRCWWSTSCASAASCASA